MNFLIKILITALLALTSFSQENDIIGKWGGIMDGNYFEIHVDTNKIHFCNNPPFDVHNYIYRSDTLYIDFIDFIISEKVDWINDSTITVSLSSEKGFLWRLNPTVKTNDEIDWSDEKDREEFHQKFLERERVASLQYLFDSVLLDVENEIINY